MSHAPSPGSILDLLLAGIRGDTDSRAPLDVSNLFSASSFSSIPGESGNLVVHLDELNDGPIQAWLMSLGNEPGVGFPWLRDRIELHTFAVWALLEFVQFLGDPLNQQAEQRLIAAASADSRVRSEVSMRFVRAVWLGYLHLVDRTLMQLGSHWDELASDLYPVFRDMSGDAIQPVDRWPFDPARWALLADAYGQHAFRFGDERLRIRQLFQLTRPSRVGGADRLTELGRAFLNPSMQAVRLLKDGYKGSVSDAIPALAGLVAASAGDRYIMTQLLGQGRDSRSREQASGFTSSPKTSGTPECF